MIVAVRARRRRAGPYENRPRLRVSQIEGITPRCWETVGPVVVERIVQVLSAVASGFHDNHAANRSRKYNRGEVVRPKLHRDEATLTANILEVVARPRRVQFDQDDVAGT